MYYRGGPLSSSLSAPIHYIYLYALSAVELLFIACSLALSCAMQQPALTLSGEHRARSDTKIFDLSAPSPRTLYILISLSLAFSLVNNVQTLSITYHRCLFCLPLFISLPTPLCSANALERESSHLKALVQRADTIHIVSFNLPRSPNTINSHIA